MWRGCQTLAGTHTESSCLLGLRMVHKENIPHHKENIPHHNCLTGCASTYNKYRRGSKPFSKVTDCLENSIYSVNVKGDFGIINENEEVSEEQETCNGNDEPKVNYHGERRRSSFCLAKLGIKIKYFPKCHNH